MTRRAKAIVACFVLVGGIYGYVSALGNRNPYYPTPGEYDVAREQATSARHWEPSPFWLPSWLVCKVPADGFGITHTKSGYLFRSRFARAAYFGSSIAVGLALGLLLAFPVFVLCNRARADDGFARTSAVKDADGAPPVTPSTFDLARKNRKGVRGRK